MIKFLNRFLIPLFAAVIITSALGMVFSTQKVIAALNEIGGNVGIADRFSMTTYDLKHFGPLYMIFVFIAFTIAMTTANLISRKMPNLKKYLFLGAGFVAIIIMLIGMKRAFFDVNLVAGARDWSGYLLQAFAGLIGGWVFYRLNQRASAKPDPQI